MRAVDPILPVEPEVHLLTSINTLPDQWIIDAFKDGLVFTSGVECAIPTTWPMCVSDEDLEAGRQKLTDSFGGDVGFSQFIAIYALECADGTLHAETEARWSREARIIFDAIKHQIVAGQLWWGQAEGVTFVAQGSGVTTVNQNLKNAATVLGAVVVADPISAIARLVAARRKLSGSGLVNIHGPLVLVDYLIAQGLIVKRGGQYVGPDFIYVTDEGYPDDAGAADGETTAGPIQTPGDPPTYYADVAGEAWLYASGRIEYAWGPYIGKNTLGENTPDGGGAPQDNDGRYSVLTSWEARQNKTYIQVEQRAFLRFDPCHILAAKCYIPTITQGEGV